MAQKIVDQTIKPEDLEKLEQKAQKAEDSKSKKKDKVQKAKKKRSANYATSKKILDNSKAYSVKEAIKSIRKALHTKFTEALECHINLGIDTKNSDQRVRFTTSLPHGIGKSIKILVISADKVSSADDKGKDGNVTWRDVKVIDEIVSGKLKPEIDFNIIIASPSVMKDLGKAARLLGPKGMMPSPKTGTITDKPEKVLEDLAKGQVEIKSQPSHAVLHQIVGDFSFKDEQLIENVNHLLQELQKNTPSKMKKKLIQKVFLTSTMGPSIRVAL